jgi:hypothetical protein
MMRVPKIDKGKYKGAKKCTIEGGQHSKLLEIIIVILYTIYSGAKEKVIQANVWYLTGSDRLRTPPGCAVSPAAPSRCCPAAKSPSGGFAPLPPA